jgi:general secretion pathway protein A
MYEKFFGFAEAPFNQTPDPHFFFPALPHEDALSQVLFGITHRKGFIVITGEAGTGKTTLCRHLLETIDPSVKTALIQSHGFTTVELLLSVNQEFGIKCRSTSMKELVDELHQFLLDTSAVGGNAVLMIDEAQNLSVECLEEIRLLSNLETTKEKLLQIILLGQPELADTLRLIELRQLAQRVALRAHLVPLDLEQTRLYIASRLRTAGGVAKVNFTAKAVERVHVLSGGIPRLINALCDKALIAGFISEKKVIDEDLIEEAGREVEGRSQARGRALPAAPVRQSRLGNPDAIQRLSHSTGPESDQRGSRFRLIRSWVAWLVSL